SLAALWGSSGKVMHNEVLTVTIAFVFLFAQAPGRRDPDSWAVRWGWPQRARVGVQRQHGLDPAPRALTVHVRGVARRRTARLVEPLAGRRRDPARDH